MVEGKYLFYYPYNEANNSRGAAQFSIPVMQDLSDKVTGEFNPKAAIERYGMAVGYQFLSKEDLSASVELAPIFSYARIVVKLDNRYPGGEVEKIVLQAGKYDHDNDETTADEQDYFNLAGQLGNKKIETIFKESKTEKTFKWSDVDKTARFALETTYSTDTDGNVVKDNAYYNEELQNKSILMVGKVPAGTSMKVDAQGNKSFETYMVMPAQEMNAPITVYLYTTDGNIYSGNTVATFNGDFNRNTPKKMEISMVEATEIPFVIASQEDWNNSVAQMGKKPASFIIADPDFTITNDLKFPTEEEAIITVDNVIVSGDNVTMKNVVAGTITVAEGAKLTTDVTTTATKIINKGTVVVAANPEIESRSAVDAYNDGLVDYAIAAIENHATLTINEEAVIATALNNKKDAEVANAGKLYVSGINNGTINNVGEIYVSTTADTEAVADFVNGMREHELNAKKDAYVVVNEPTINNKATGKFRADADFINYSLFVNEGILSCKNNAGTITNSTNTLNEVKYIGIIDAKTNSTNYISANNGKVIVYDMLQANVTTNGGVVEYTATGASVVTDASIVTDIIATKDLEVKYNDATGAKACKIQDLTIKGNATIKMTWPTGKTPATLKVLTVESGNVTLASNISTESLIVKKGAVINVPKDLTLTVTKADYANAGTISVAGTMKAELVNRVNSGNVEDNGLGTLKWLPTAKEQALEDYQEALKDFIGVWVNATGTKYAVSASTVNYDLLDEDAVGLMKNYYRVYTGDKTELEEAIEAYNEILEAEYEENKTEDSEDYVAVKLEDEYAAAVALYVAEVKNGTGSTFAADVVKENILAGYRFDDNVSYFTVDDVTTTTVNETEVEALKQFKGLVVANTALTNRSYKAALCTATTWSGVSAYVPAYHFPMTSNNMYKLFDEIINGGYTFTGTELSTAITDLTSLKKWVENAAIKKIAEMSTANQIAYDFVTGKINNVEYAVYKEALKWQYNAKTIVAVKEATANN